MRYFLLSVVSLMICVFAYSQEEKSEKPLKGTHQLSLFICHSHVFDGVNEDGKKEWLVLPSWALDYNYWIRDRLAIGLQTDIITENFKVENRTEGNEVIERSHPFAAVAAVSFKPKKHSVFILGLGGEFASEENFLLTRLSYEFGWELTNKWELAASFVYDVKWNAYDTWTIGLGVSKLIRRSK